MFFVSLLVLFFLLFSAKGLPVIDEAQQNSLIIDEDRKETRGPSTELERRGDEQERMGLALEDESKDNPEERNPLKKIKKLKEKIKLKIRKEKLKIKVKLKKLKFKIKALKIKILKVKKIIKTIIITGKIIKKVVLKIIKSVIIKVKIIKKIVMKIVKTVIIIKKIIKKIIMKIIKTLIIKEKLKLKSKKAKSAIATAILLGVGLGVGVRRRESVGSVAPASFIILPWPVLFYLQNLNITLIVILFSIWFPSATTTRW